MAHYHHPERLRHQIPSGIITRAQPTYQTMTACQKAMDQVLVMRRMMAILTWKRAHRLPLITKNMNTISSSEPARATQSRIRSARRNSMKKNISGPIPNYMVYAEVYCNPALRKFFSVQPVLTSNFQRRPVQQRKLVSIPPLLDIFIVTDICFYRSNLTQNRTLNLSVVVKRNGAASITPMHVSRKKRFRTRPAVY